nr:hypothetical protein [Alistipes onderdonkii]
MKSEKAKELIEKYAVGNSRDAAPSMMKGRVIECVELAEQEAEERMRKRAIGAFDDMWFENGEDGEFEPDYEYHRKNFIQKLTENENDD